MSRLLPRPVLQSRRDVRGQEQPQRPRVHPDAVPENGVRPDGEGRGQALGGRPHLLAVFQDSELPRGPGPRPPMHLRRHSQGSPRLLSAQTAQKNVLPKVGHSYSRVREQKADQVYLPVNGSGNFDFVKE